MSRLSDVSAAIVFLALVNFGFSIAQAADAKSSCNALSSIEIKDTVVKGTYITTPEELALALGNTEASESSSALAVAKLPFCRVQFTTTPVPGAEINSEVWLPPADKWNGRFLGAGNGGPAGVLSQSALSAGAARGYAVAHSDAGSHSEDKLGPNATPIGFRFGAINKEWRINYAHRGYHAMTDAAKRMTQAYYGTKPVASLFMGCSGGGYEALGEAQRYPDDYDGIISGDPAIEFARVGLWQGMSYVESARASGGFLPPEKLPLVAKLIMNKCDKIDGISDGVIDDPRKCKPDFREWQCKSGDGADCLTESQADVLNKLYADYHHPRTSAFVYPRFTPGAELTPGAQARLSNVSPATQIYPAMPGALVWILGKNFEVADWMKFDFDKNADRVITEFAPYENTNPNINSFLDRKGKLILYSGYADPNLNAMALINYYEAVKKTVGEKKSQGAVRLFMVPGMYHCAGGPGPNAFGQALVGTAAATKHDADNDILLALDRWVTQGVAPERLIATKFQDDKPEKGAARSRSLCAFPKVAKWSGKNSSDDSENFFCAVP